MANRVHKFRSRTNSVDAGPQTQGVWGDPANNLNFSSENSTNPRQFQNYALPKFVRIPLVATAVGTEIDTGYDLPASAVVLDVYLEVSTAEATGSTKTMDIGTLSSESGGDADGFMDNASAATTGVRVGSIVSGAVTRGALLKQVGTDSGSATLSVQAPYAVTANTARSISYTLGSNNWVEFRGNIIISFLEF